MSRFFFLLAFVLLAGCGKSQPPELQNAIVMITGHPNQEFYLSVDRITHTVDGKQSATVGTSNYGKRVLDDGGELELTFEDDHGLDVVLVAFTDDPLKLSVKADNATEKVAEVSEQLTFAHVKLGYEPEQDSVFASDPEASVHEARQLLKAATE